MPELSPPAARNETHPTPAPGRKLASRLLVAAVVPVVLATLFGMATVAYLLLAPASAAPGVRYAVAAAGAAGCLIAILVALLRARSTAHALDDRVNQLRHWSSRHREELRLLTEQWGRGETPRPFGIETPVADGDELAELHNDLMATRHAALTAMTSVPQPIAAETPVAGVARPDGFEEARAEVFVNLARRLQALLHREIQLLDEMESQVEDPDFLKGLFAIDHLATRIRRHAENLAVLGGAGNRRQWSRPVAVNDILRSAVAEIEQYVRVKLVRPLEGSVQGHAVADVVHLVAELVENATRFSAPHTNVVLRTERVTAGLAVEVEDRGLGIPRDDQNKINVMLRTPDVVNFDELLRDGRIGLFVVGALARRHSIAVQVQTNIYGGTQSVLVIPNELLGEDTPAPESIAAAAPTGSTEGRAIEQPSQAEQLAMTQEMAAVSGPPAYDEPQPPPPSDGPTRLPHGGPAAGEPPHVAGFGADTPASAPPYAAAAEPEAASPVSAPAGFSSTGSAYPAAAPSYAAETEPAGSAAASGFDTTSPTSAIGATTESTAESSGRLHTGEAIAGARQSRKPGDETEAVTSSDGLPAPKAMSRSLFEATPAEPVVDFEPARPRSAPPADSRPSPSPRPRTAPVTAGESPAGNGHGEMSWSSPAPSPRPRPADEDRPRLPQRRRQENLAPELREAPAPVQVASGDGEDRGHDPGLMSAFKRGRDRADDGDSETSPDN